MGDIVTRRAVLAKKYEGSDQDYLLLTTTGKDLRTIPVRPQGTPKHRAGPEWEYVENPADMLLDLEPSLRCLDSEFHTDYHWQVPYELLPEGKTGYDHFYDIHPDLKESS